MCVGHNRTRDCDCALLKGNAPHAREGPPGTARVVGIQNGIGYGSAQDDIQVRQPVFSRCSRSRAFVYPPA